MIELTQPRKRSGQFRKSGWHNFKKRKRGWREYAMHPITVSIFGLVAYVGIHTAYAMNDMKSLDGRVEIIREPVDQSSLRGTASGNTGETASQTGTPTTSQSGNEVEAVSDSATSEEGQTPSKEPSPSSIEAKILKAWEGTGKGHIAVAVAKSESGLRSNAIGWNCHYTIQGMKYSKACNPEDRPKAWSVDCGVMQINHIGKTCPAHLFNPDENIKIGKAKYDNSEKRIGIGFYPWMAFRNNLHLKYL